MTGVLLFFVSGVFAPHHHGKNNLMSSKFSEKQEPVAIVVAPTRELSIQTYMEAMKLSKGTMIQAAVV